MSYSSCCTPTAETRAYINYSPESNSLTRLTTSAPRRVALLVDTVNLYRRAQQTCGSAARPDYRRILEDVNSLGRVVQAVALFNDGVPERYPVELRRFGFAIRFSHARNLDDALVAEAVRLHRQVDCFVLASHDGDYRHLAALLKASGRDLVVCAIRRCCSRKLLGLASAFYDLPLIRSLVPEPSATGKSG